MSRRLLVPLVVVGALLLVATGALAGVLLAQDEDSSSDTPGNSSGSGQSYLGLSVAPSTDGLRVSGVAAGSPAARAGIQAGDILRSIEGEVVRTPEQLRSAIAAKKPGDEVSITYERGSREFRVQIELADATPGAQGVTTPTPAAGRPGTGGLPGLESLPQDVRERLQRELAAGRLTPQELQQFLRLYQARGENARVGTVVSVNPGIVGGTFILTLKPYSGGDNVAVQLDQRTSVLRGGTPIQPGDLRQDELVLVISMDGGQTAFGVLATGVRN